MTHFVILLLVVGGTCAYLMNSKERQLALRAGWERIRELQRWVALEDLRLHPFYVALHQRTRWTFVTPAICALDIAIFILMFVDGKGGLGPDTMIAWGASDRTRIMHGEWWRLASTIFVHAGWLHLVVNILGLVQIGLIVERTVGPVTFAVVYMAAGIAAGLISLMVAPSSMSVGGSAATLGIYGLMMASTAWSAFRQAALALPWRVIRRISPTAAVFMLYAIATSRHSEVAILAAMMTGLAGGLFVLRDIGERQPPMRRVAAAMATALVLSAVYGVIMRQPVSDTTHVQSAIGRLIAAELHTAHVYNDTVERFRKGREAVGALIQVIEGTILPELHTASAVVGALDHVPPEQEGLVRAAFKYLDLRVEGWRLRARALHSSNLLMLREADRQEQDSLREFQVVMVKHRELH